MDFAQLSLGTKIWNTSWPKTTYLIITTLNKNGEAKSLQVQGVHPPYLSEPTVSKILIHQEVNGMTLESIWITNQSALLDPNWTLIDPTITADKTTTTTTTTESTADAKATTATVS